MPTPSQLINGQSYSWSNIVLTVLGNPIAGITKISYDSKQTKSNNYGWFNIPVSRGYGNVTYTGSIEMELSEWRAICKISPNGDPLQMPWFNISVSYGSFEQGQVFAFTDVLQNCEFLENPISASQGDTSLKVTIPLIIAGITRMQ